MFAITDVLKIARDVMEDEDLTPSSRLKDAMNYDSMALVQFIIEITENFNISVEDDEIQGSMKIEDVWEIIKRKKE